MATANIPVIDIGSGRDEKDVARELVDAAVEFGFIYVKGGSVRAERAFELSKHLFSTSDAEEKKRCAIQKNNRGWSGVGSETLDPKTQKAGDFKEAFNFGEFVDGKAQQPVPAALAPHEDEISDIFGECHALSRRILYLLGVGLEVNPPDFFSAAHLTEKGPSGTILRFLHYPSVESAQGTAESIRAGAHSDYGSLTLLFRLKGQAGLQILTPSSTWASVPVHPPGTETDASPPVLVNIGDMLSHWTNGLLKSTVHRVTVEPGDAVPGEGFAGDRYSIAFFCHPVGETRLEAVPSEAVRKAAAGGASGDRVLTADEHLDMRLRASYLELYKE